MGCCEFFLDFFLLRPMFNISLHWIILTCCCFEQKSTIWVLQLWTSPLKTVSVPNKTSHRVAEQSVRMRWKQLWKNTRISFSVRACSGNWCHSGRPWLLDPQHCRGTPLLTTIHRLFFSFSGGNWWFNVGMFLYCDWNREAPWVAGARGARSSPEIWQMTGWWHGGLAQNRLLYPLVI